MKQFFIPKRIGRLEFFLFSIAALGLIIFLSVIGLAPLAAILFVPMYITYANARVKSWGGKADAWSAFLILFSVISFSLVSSGSPYPPIALTFIIFHLYFQFRRGKPSEGYERIKENASDKKELRRLKAEKKKLERKQEIEQLRKEVHPQSFD